MESKCPVCKAADEDWEHYEYECKGVREMNERVAESMGREHAFSKEEWRLEKEGMENREMIAIAKARWIYHCERCKIDMKQRRRLNITILMNKLNRRIQIATESK